MTKILRAEKHMITRYYRARLQIAKQALATSKHSIGIAYSDFPCQLKVNAES